MLGYVWVKCGCHQLNCGSWQASCSSISLQVGYTQARQQLDGVTDSQLDERNCRECAVVDNVDGIVGQQPANENDNLCLINLGNCCVLSGNILYNVDQ